MRMQITLIKTSGLQVTESSWCEEMDLPRILRKASLVSPAVLAAALSVEMGAIATEIHSATRVDRTIEPSVVQMSATLPPLEPEALTIAEVEEEKSAVSNLVIEPMQVAELPGEGRRMTLPIR